MKKVLFTILALVLAGSFYFYREYNRAPESGESLKSDLSVSANKLLEDFENDESAANAMYLDKIVEVSGKVSVINSKPKNAIIIETANPMSSIICEFGDDFNPNSVKINDVVKVKGKCTGYLMDVVLIRCALLDK